MRVVAIALFGCFALGAVAHAASGDTLYVQADKTKVYEAPWVTAPVTMQLDRGDAVVELGRDAWWVKVGILGAVGKDGWVHRSNLGPEDPNATDAAGEAPQENVVAGVFEGPRKVTPEDIGLVDFLLQVTGPPARVFKARCRIITENEEEIRRTITGDAPKGFRIQAKAVRCRVSQPGQTRANLRLKVTVGGKVKFYDLAGKYSALDVYTPWDW